MKKLFLHIVILLITNLAFSQNYAKLTCVSIGEDGYITLNWDLVPGTNQTRFIRFDIYQNLTNVEPYNYVDFIDDSTITSKKLSVKLGDLDLVRYFKINTVYQDGKSISSKLSTIALTIENKSNFSILNWNQFLDLSNNSLYYINRKFPNENWEIIDSVSSNTTTFTDKINDCSNPVLYKITTKSSNCTQTSNTESRKISLNLSDNLGAINLTWNQFLDTNEDSKYYIHKEYPLGNWHIIDSVESNIFSYNDTLHTCGGSANYKIAIRSNCTQFSNTLGGIFVDGDSPQQPILKSVSLNPISKIFTISWIISPDIDVTKYIILKNNYPLETIYGRNTSSFEIISAIPSLENDSYQIMAKDSCDNPSAPSISHKPSFVKAQYNACFKTTNLNWTTYTGWSSISKYEVYCSINSAEFLKIGTTTGLAKEFTHNGILDDKIYQYYVKAFDQTENYSSFSNIAEVSTMISSFNYKISANYASVISSNEIKIKFDFDVSDAINEYKIFKSSDSISGFQELKSYSNSTIPLDSIVFTDINNSINAVYYYKLRAYNECDVLVGESNVTNTILLTVDNSSNLKHKLLWKTYNALQSGVELYNIYRSVDDENYEFLISLSGDVNSYIDDISDMNFTNVEGRFCYYIQAIEKTTDIFGNLSISNSNIACAVQYPRVFIPNAITPNADGINDELKPFSKFISDKEYVFIIYNRWGNKIFESNSPNQSWNGMLNGKVVEMGVYTYFIHFVTAEDLIFEDVGTITVF